MTAVEFLDKLEQQGLLDERLVSALRQQVAEAPKTVSAQKIAKLLIDKGHLTAFQAKKLIDDGAKSSAKAPRAEKPRPAAPAAADDDLELVDEGEDDLGLELVDEEAAPVAPASPEENDLELVDLDEAPPAKPAPAAAGRKPAAAKTSPGAAGGRASAEDLLDVTPLDNDLGLTPVAAAGLTPLSASPGLTPRGKPAASPPSSLAAPPLDGLEPVDPLATDLSATADPLAAPPTPAQGGGVKKIRKVKGNPWDTPLMVLGGGAVILLPIVAFFLYRFITATSASEVFQAAQDAYRAESYTQAISIYEEFLRTFPDDPNAGPAWVLIRTARMRQVVQGKNWDQALQTAKEALGEIDNSLIAEKPPVANLPAAFNEHGRPELATLLPSIAAGFAAQAKNAKTVEDAKKRVAQADDAMTLVNNAAYIPSSLREAVEARIDAIREDIALARRNIHRDEALAAAIGQIDGALAKNDTPAAFETRKALLRTYPELERHPHVLEAVRKTTEKERELVVVVEEPRAPATDDPANGGAAKVVPAAIKVDAPPPGVEGAVVAFLVRGAVYGLDATTGQVLWRRPVGLETNVHPQRVAPDPTADVILVDNQRQDLVRVEGKTGRVVWRLPIGSSAAAPVLVGERLFLAAESGLLYEVNLDSGASARQVKFPQPLRAPPAVDEARGLIFQVGEHSNLYVLSSETLDCKAVYYLNHRAGTIATPPTLSRGQMLLAENAGADFCRVHVLPATDDLAKLKPSQDPFRLRGNVLAPPYVYERRILLVTDLGGVSLFEIDTANKQQPVSIVAELSPTLREPAIGFSLAESGQLWVADARLARYEIQAARGELVRRPIRDEQSIYVAPLQMRGGVLFHARRQTNAEGVIVTAADANTLRPFWTAALGTPMVGLFADPASSRVAAVSAQGDLFQLAGNTLAKAPAAQAPPRDAAAWAEAAFEPPVRLPDGRFAFPGVVEKNRILMFDPQASQSLQAVELQLPEGRATAAPVAFQGGLLVPSSAGLVYLADPDSGESLALPLRPPMTPGEQVVWQAPTVTADGKEFVIASNQPKIYRVVLRQQPKPHLAALTVRDLAAPIVSRLATAGGVVYGVERSSQGDALLRWELPALSVRRIPLPGRLAWGPHPVGDAVLLATHEMLMRWDGDVQPRWTRPLPYGPPVAPPGEWDGDYVFAAVGGTVWRVAADTGEESSKTVVSEPLAAGPAVAGSRLLVGGSDGVLHVVSWGP